MAANCRASRPRRARSPRCGSAGRTGCDYFINTVPADGGDTLKEGGEITQANSVLYRGRSEVPGLRIPPARFRLG